MNFYDAVYEVLALLLPYVAILWIFREAQRAGRDTRQALIAALDSSQEREDALTRALFASHDPSVGGAYALQNGVRDDQESEMLGVRIGS